MGKIITLMNEKGGVGKSSLTYSVAWELAKNHQKVLIIDMDGQMANITYLAGVETGDDTKTMNDVLLHNTSIKDAIVRVHPELSLDLVPATMAMAEPMITAKVSRIKKVVKEIRNQYDYIFFDVNPSPDTKHALTLAVTDYVGIVMLPDVLSLEANLGVIESIQEIQDGVNVNLQILGIILNQYNTQTNMSKAVMKKVLQMAEALDTKVLEQKVRKAVVVGESAVAHQGVTGYAPKSAVAADMEALTKEIQQEVQ